MITKDLIQQLFNLGGCVTSVIGAGSGIGQTTACVLASAGTHVICFDLCEDGGLNATVDAIIITGAQAALYTGDVRQLSDFRAVVALAEEHFGRLDIAVNAVGIVSTNPALETKDEQWQHVIDVNLIGVWSSHKVEAELILESGDGPIIDITSMSGITISRDLERAHYNSTRAKVTHLSKSLMMKWIGRGIRVNSISPGYIATSMNTRPEMVHQTREFEGQASVQCMTKVEEIAGPVLSLASDIASFHTGIDLVVGGGFICWQTAIRP